MKKNFYLIGFLFLSLPLVVQGAFGNIVINEIAWMGTENSHHNDEWVELYNNSSSDLELKGWRLLSKDGTPEVILENKIPGKGFFILERTDDTSLPEIKADLIYKGNLNNTGEHLKLINSEGKLVDEVDCSSGWFTGDNSTKQTMERKSLLLSGNNPESWQTSQNPGGTPKAENSTGGANETEPIPTAQDSPEPATTPVEPRDKPAEIEIPLSYPSGIIFNEILPSPEGPDAEEEWIEIYNQNNFEVDLFGWKIQDTEGKVTIYTIPTNTKIKAKNYLVLLRPLTKITLNNTSDGLKLSQPNNKVIDSVIFQKAPMGQSYNRIPLEGKPLTGQAASEWMWSSTLTPGVANIIFSSQTITKAEPKQNQDSQIDKTNYKAGLAEIYSSLSRNLPGVENPWFLFLIASGIAISSGIIVFFLKRKINKNTETGSPET